MKNQSEISIKSKNLFILPSKSPFPLGRLGWVFIIFLFSTSINAQNLIHNPSFEDTVMCYGYNNNQDSILEYWRQPTIIGITGCCGFYRAPCLYTSPNSPTGYQQPNSGKAYVFISVYNSLGDSIAKTYQVGELKTELKASTCYKFTAKVSLANSSIYSIYDLGVYFSDIIPNYTPIIHQFAVWNPLNYTPQIVFNQFVDDTTNWVTIERYYLAQGGEKFITLGSFKKNSNVINNLVSQLINPTFHNAIYYLDDVSLEEVSITSLPKFSLGNDTLLCKGEKITFEDFLPPNSVYVWNSYSNDSVYTIDSSGTYWLEAYNGCSYSADTIVVNYLDIDLGEDTILCKREEKLLDATTPYSTYLWSDNSTESTLSVLDSGLYWVTVDMVRCSSSDTIYIENHIPKNATLNAYTTDTIFCEKGELDAGSSSWNDKYLWSTNETTQTIKITESGTYSVYAENECTEAQSIYAIKIDELEEGLNNYNIFSPNGDFINDVFSIYEGNNEEYDIEIYNRWGVQIWSTTDPANHWKGEGVNDGTYYFTLSFRNCAGEIIQKKGTVVLSR